MIWLWAGVAGFVIPSALLMASVFHQTDSKRRMIRDYTNAHRRIDEVFRTARQRMDQLAGKSNEHGNWQDWL